MEPNSLLEINGLRKDFVMHTLNGKRIEALSDINMTLKHGEIIGLVGKSGSGKSTLMKCIYRTYLSTGGSIWFDSEQYSPIDLCQANAFEMINLRRTEITYCSQFLQVIPRVPALDVVGEGLLRFGYSAQEARDQAREYLRDLGLPQELWDAFPSTFSGGEQQRINVARAIIARPRFLLIDEPTASLDAKTKDKVIEMVLALKSAGTSILCITHDQYTLDNMCDKTIALKKRNAGRKLPHPMKTLSIINADIVLPERVISGGSVMIENGIITAIRENAALPDTAEHIIDAEGSTLLPGIIDLHTDAMDIEICPRPGADFPIDVAFQELDRKMAGCGITTVFHSMHMGYATAEKNTRSKYSREEVFETIRKLCNQEALVNNKIHLRFEITGTYAYEGVLKMLDSGLVDLLSIMDHTPGQGQNQTERYLEVMKKEGMTEAEAMEQLQSFQRRERINGEKLERIISKCKEQNIPVASHDDDSPEKVIAMNELGVTIAEFPINNRSAEKASELGMSRIGGASNVLRGGSLSKNMNVRAAIEQGLIDCLCSDYYPASIIHAAYKLYNDRVLSLPQISQLISLNPAKAVDIDGTTGSIALGKYADLLLVEDHAGKPFISHTFVKGVIVSKAQHTRLKATEKKAVWHA